MKNNYGNKKNYAWLMKGVALNLFFFLSVFSAAGAPSAGREILESKTSLPIERTTIKEALRKIEAEENVWSAGQANQLNANCKAFHTPPPPPPSLSPYIYSALGVPLYNNKEIGGKRNENPPVLKSNNPNEDLVIIKPAIVDVAATQVSGKVLDETGLPLPGVNVIEKGTANGSITDADGGFLLEVESSSSVLVFSFIGYETKEIAVGSQVNFEVTLRADVKKLDEVVVVGYGTQRKQDVTGAISEVKSSDLRTQGANTIQKSLQGRMAGVQIESNGGDPGSGVKILIRGTGTLGSNNPLYIVDGVQVDNINNINPSDIESISILKDASAAAIYGSRAANGVVLVTLKSGKSGAPKIDFNSYYGVQSQPKQYPVLNAAEWASVNNAAHDNAGQARNPIANNPMPTGEGTDWQKAIYRAAPVQNYALSVSGGGDGFNYNFSSGYLNQDGIVKKTGYERINLTMKSEFTKGRLKLGESIILSRENTSPMPPGLGGQGGGPVSSALKMIPVFQIYDPAALGGYGGAYGSVVDVANPVASLNLQTLKNNTNTVIANVFAELTLIEGLKYRYNLGYTNTSLANSDYLQPYVVGQLYNNQQSKLKETRTQTNYFLQEHTLNYSKKLDKHQVEALVGFTYQETKYKTVSGYKTGMPDGIYVLDAGSSNVSAGSNASEHTLVSLLGRIVYSYDDRYMLTATLRRDGSSRFSPANRFGIFPSYGVGWNISNEKFFKPAENIVSSLKLRSTYGVLGNQDISDYLYTPAINLNSNYVKGQPEQLWNGATQTAFATPGIKWESSYTFDIGLDWGFFQDKLNFTVDYFDKKNEDILLKVPVPLSSGASDSPPYLNAGTIRNRGLEAALTYHHNKGDFKYNLNAVLTSINNQVVVLGSGTQQIFGGQPTHHGASATVTQAGLPVGGFFLIKSLGIFQSQDEINGYAKKGTLIQPNAKPGDLKFEDANGDGTISQNDRVYAGSPTPKFSFGFGGNASWKNFDLSVFFQGTQGNKIYNGFRQDLESMSLEFNYERSTLNAWTPDNRNTDVPRAVSNDPNSNIQTSTRFLENGSYLRFKTLQVGYTLPKVFLERIKFTQCRVYLSADNLATLTAYRGFNPDIGRANTLDRGVDHGHNAYPLSRTFLVGIQLTF